jgi:hypothetical protein
MFECSSFAHKAYCFSWVDAISEIRCVGLIYISGFQSFLVYIITMSHYYWLLRTFYVARFFIPSLQKHHKSQRIIAAFILLDSGILNLL